MRADQAGHTDRRAAQETVTGPETDLMDAPHPIRLDRAYHDLDGVDWRLLPHDDAAVLDVLHPDPARSDLAAAE